MLVTNAVTFLISKLVKRDTNPLAHACTNQQM